MIAQYREKMIRDYFNASDNSDVEGMLAVFHPDVEYIHLLRGIEGVIDGEVQIVDRDTLSIDKNNSKIVGISAFRAVFESRDTSIASKKTEITSIFHSDKQVEVRFCFTAIAGAREYAEEFKIKAGDLIESKGKYVFLFKDGLIWKLYDLY